MKNFEIIEEGRLNKSEMGTIMGGVLYCSEKYLVEDPKICTGTKGRAVCPVVYISCLGGTETTCISSQGGHAGIPGPAGDGGVAPTTCSSNPLVAYAGNIAGEIFDGPSSAEVC